MNFCKNSTVRSKCNYVYLSISHCSNKANPTKHDTGLTVDSYEYQNIRQPRHLRRSPASPPALSQPAYQLSPTHPPTDRPVPVNKVFKIVVTGRYRRVRSENLGQFWRAAGLGAARLAVALNCEVYVEGSPSQTFIP